MSSLSKFWRCNILSCLFLDWSDTDKILRCLSSRCVHFLARSPTMPSVHPESPLEYYPASRTCCMITCQHQHFRVLLIGLRSQSAQRARHEVQRAAPTVKQPSHTSFLFITQRCLDRTISLLSRFRFAGDPYGTHVIKPLSAHHAKHEGDFPQAGRELLSRAHPRRGEDASS